MLPRFNIFGESMGRYRTKDRAIHYVDLNTTLGERTICGKKLNDLLVTPYRPVATCDTCRAKINTSDDNGVYP